VYVKVLPEAGKMGLVRAMFFPQTSTDSWGDHTTGMYESEKPVDLTVHVVPLKLDITRLLDPA
jgi:hypothetical protein